MRCVGLRITLVQVNPSGHDSYSEHMDEQGLLKPGCDRGLISGLPLVPHLCRDATCRVPLAFGGGDALSCSAT